ncbi:MAG: PilZ domain-containing protein [Pseudomonadota bacterium]
MLVTIPKRQSKRVRVLLDALLVSSVGEVEVRVRDVSQEGALLEVGDNAPHQGEITLFFLDHSQQGSIAWREGSWLGVHFDQALPKSVWKALSTKRLRVGAPRTYRHDEIEEDPERIAVIPRRIELRLGSK